MYKEYIRDLFDLIEKIEIDRYGQPINDFETGMTSLEDCFRRIRNENRQAFFIGNGGSSAIASHMTADFMKNGNIRTNSIYDNAVTTCLGNDYGYEYIFSKPIEYLMNEGDILVAISSSGDSESIINAIKAAKQKGALVITFTGFKCDNRARKEGDFNVYVPIEHYGKVESLHNILLQQIVDMLYE